jgi:hypothetical protein
LDESTFHRKSVLPFSDADKLLLTTKISEPSKLMKKDQRTYLNFTPRSKTHRDLPDGTGI